MPNEVEMRLYKQMRICLFTLGLVIFFIVTGATGATVDTVPSTSAIDNPNTSNTDIRPPYVLGQGYKLGDSGVTLGGYTSLQFQDSQNSAPHSALSHLSLFVWWENSSRFSLFSEVDNQKILAADSQSEGDDDASFLSIERLYIDYAFNDALTLRGGKFLTPIGRWNQLHADPLVWTTSRPLITVNLFPEHATGGMAMGNVSLFGKSTEYTLYVSTSTDLHPDPAEGQFNDIHGARLNYPVNDNLQLGISYAGFDKIMPVEEREELAGLDFIWASHGVELSGEGVWRWSNLGTSHNASGGFFQGVIPLSTHLFGVGRIESIRNPDLQNTTQLWLWGLNYRYNRAISLKVEVIHPLHQSISDPGFLSSVSVLF